MLEARTQDITLQAEREKRETTEFIEILKPGLGGGCQCRLIVRIYVREIDGSTKQNTHNDSL